MPRAQRFPHPVPYGWYFVGYGDELAVGEVRPLRYFGRDLVMFRDENGKAGMLDAHCPHLGAHLGHGGHVKGELLHCPFHGWGYDAQGWCKDISYASTLPPICKREPITHAYPLTETNGVIWAWYHPHNIAPLFEAAAYEEFNDPTWAKQTRHEWRCAINPQEVAENALDTAHFQFVHGTPGVPEGYGVYEGHTRRSGSDTSREVEMADGTVKWVEMGVHSVANGAAQKITKLKGPDVAVWLMVLVTPIEVDDAEIRFAYTHPKAEPGSAEEAAYAAACVRISGENGVLSDLPIWNNKIHQSRPILCDGDGPILAYRKWFEQFYVYDKEPQRIAAE